MLGCEQKLCTVFVKVIFRQCYL